MPPTDEQFWILLGLGAVAAILAFVVRGLVLGKPRTLPAQGPLRLMVRPLKELKPDPNNLYLGTTIARELTSGLKHYERLDPAVGESRAGLSIDGTVTKTGPRVVIAIRLLNGRHPIWNGTYDGAISDLAQMEGEIAQNVARVLQVPVRKPVTPGAVF